MELIVKYIIFVTLCAVGVHCVPIEADVEFKKAGISPWILDPPPKDACQVSWPNGASAGLGNKFTASEVSSPPRVTWACDGKEQYSIFLIGDNPVGANTRVGSEARLWLVVNITNCNWNSSETIFAWFPPSPLRGTGIHRYILAVFRQPSRLFYEETFEASK